MDARVRGRDRRRRWRWFPASDERRFGLIPELVRYPGDACGHPRDGFGAGFLVFANHPTAQSDPPADDAHLHAVPRNGQIPMQRCHDCEFDALVDSPLPIVPVVRSELELRGKVACWSANRQNGLACSFVSIVPSALHLVSPLSLRLWMVPAAHNAEVDTRFPGGCSRNGQLQSK
jgi:hypothetical protein